MADLAIRRRHALVGEWRWGFALVVALGAEAVPAVIARRVIQAFDDDGRDGALMAVASAGMGADTSNDQADRGPTREASVVVARDAKGFVALLNAPFPDHGGDYLFLPGGRREPGESPEECARRELREESGITAEVWRPLGSYALTLTSPARIHLYEARDLTCGPQQLTPTEVDFELTWWSMDEALHAATEGRFLLPAGPLALFLAERATRG